MERIGCRTRPRGGASRRARNLAWRMCRIQQSIINSRCAGFMPYDRKTYGWKTVGKAAIASRVGPAGDAARPESAAD